jgi:hypothetical protein
MKIRAASFSTGPIEIFERGRDGTFQRGETIVNPWLVDPNAIAAVGPCRHAVQGEHRDSRKRSTGETISATTGARCMSIANPKIVVGVAQLITHNLRTLT